MINKYELILEPETNYYEEILSDFLEHHSKQEIVNILLIEALYEKKIKVPANAIELKLNKGEIK